ncbi:MAG: PD-(D/E)XK nuclease family protein [Bacteroidota bacterium]
METFLGKTARHIYAKHQDDLGLICIVLPNRRAGLFLKKHFSALIAKPVWSPDIYSIEDFIEKLSGMRKADPIALLFELYGVYRETMKDKAETFDEFARWGQILLQDYSEIDRCLADAEQLFGNLGNIKEVEHWSLAGDALTDFQRSYLQFFTSLGTLYTHLNERLREKNLAYQGMAYRAVAGSLAGSSSALPWKKIFFAGFNALSAAEEKIFSFLVQSGQAEVLWDTDAYYLDDHRQEAGKFLRLAIPRLKKDPKQELLWKENLLSTDNKRITIIGAPRNVAQAKTAGAIVQELAGSPSSTAIVLADEKLLFPVLHSLPADLQYVNVTMGYPLRSTPPAALVDIVFGMQETARKFSRGRKGELRFYHKDLLRLLAHPYIRAMLSGSGLGYRLSSQIVSRNYVFASRADLEKFAEEGQKADLEKLRPLLDPWSGVPDALRCLEALAELLRTVFLQEEEKRSLEAEYIFGFSKIFKRLASLNSDYGYITDTRTLHALLRQIISSTTLPFYGEPLSGLQVMGVLETRTLDFENLVILSVNEDVIPTGKTQHTFIPYDLKKAFGLPTYSDKDAVFAYHFYRLLQRAKNIYLLYNTEADGLGNGEKSRYIAQLQYELPRVNPNVVIEEQFLQPEDMRLEKGEIRIEKSQEVLEKLYENAEQGFSPSALNIFKSCSLHYYFRYVAGLHEQDEVEETIGADTLGTVVHRVLEELYAPYRKRALGTEDIRKMKEAAPALAEKYFSELFSDGELRFGKNLLTLKVAVRFLLNFLDAEIKFVSEREKAGEKLIIEELEYPLGCSLDVKGRKINLSGHADRIDRVGSLLRIVDYKTGRAEDKELRFDDWEAIVTETRLNKSFQLMTYAYMYAMGRSGRAETAVSSGIISFRELSAGLKTVKAAGSDLLDSEKLDQFGKQLAALLEKLIDEKQPFTQTTDLEVCAWCGFKTICNRN